MMALQRKSGRWADAAYWTLWGVTVALYIVWPLTHLEAYAWSNDEGLYVQRAALANAGYTLYTEIALNKPPLLIWILQLAFRLAGPTIATARLTSLGLTLLGFAALGAVAGQLWGRWAGLASALVWLALAEVPVRAQVVTSDLPAMAFALIALAAALRFRRSGRPAWLVLTSASFAGALLIHPLLIYMGVPLAGLLLLPGRFLGMASARRLRARDWAILAGTALAAGLLVLVAIDPRAFATWVLGRNVESASAAQGTAVETNLKLMSGYLAQNWPLLLLAAAATATCLFDGSRRRRLVIPAAWFLATGLTLLLWSPVWLHYLLFLTLPLAIVAGAGIAALGRRALERPRDGRERPARPIALGVATLAAMVAFAAHRYGEPLPYLTPEWSPGRREARAFLENSVPAGGFVASDDPLLAFAAGRLVPPPLTGISLKWIHAGLLTTGDVIDSIVRYRAPVVLFSRGRIEKLPALESWVAAVASERRDFDDLRAYRLNQPLTPANAAAARLGDGIALTGYSLDPAMLHAGETVTVTLFWERDAVVSGDAHVFVHLVDGDDRIWGQHDGPTLLGAYPAGRWSEGLLLPDPHILPVDPQAPAGTYHLVVGMYAWPSLERLPASRPDGSRWPDERIVLAELAIVAP